MQLSDDNRFLGYSSVIKSHLSVKKSEREKQKDKEMIE